MLIVYNANFVIKVAGEYNLTLEDIEQAVICMLLKSFIVRYPHLLLIYQGITVNKFNYNTILTIDDGVNDYDDFYTSICKYEIDDIVDNIAMAFKSVVYIDSIFLENQFLYIKIN